MTGRGVAKAETGRQHDSTTAPRSRRRRRPTQAPNRPVQQLAVAGQQRPPPGMLCRALSDTAFHLGGPPSAAADQTGARRATGDEQQQRQHQQTRAASRDRRDAEGQAQRQRRRCAVGRPYNTSQMRESMGDAYCAVGVRPQSTCGGPPANSQPRAHESAGPGAGGCFADAVKLRKL
jgi:hypothetical protein